MTDPVIGFVVAVNSLRPGQGYRDLVLMPWEVVYDGVGYGVFTPYGPGRIMEVLR